MATIKENQKGMRELREIERAITSESKELLAEQLVSNPSDEKYPNLDEVRIYEAIRGEIWGYHIVKLMIKWRTKDLKAENIKIKEKENGR